jgi:1-aminocyclopropane-1-carboxylate deaminase/D-cysteine desulfhydrase-like pyridoxal-dependent ACC family enzyme
MAGLSDLIRKHEFRSDQNVWPWWHTGGTPALFAYAKQFEG